MAIWEPIVTQLLLDGFLHRPIKSITTRKKAAWWLIALSGFLGVVGVVYLIIALHLYFLTIYSEVQAALLTGGSSLLLAGIGGIGFFILEEGRKMKMKAHAALHRHQTGDLMDIVEKLTRNFEEPIANNPRTSAILASLAGYIAGEKIH